MVGRGGGAPRLPAGGGAELRGGGPRGAGRGRLCLCRGNSCAPADGLPAFSSLCGSKTSALFTGLDVRGEVWTDTDWSLPSSAPQHPSSQPLPAAWEPLPTPLPGLLLEGFRAWGGGEG